MLARLRSLGRHREGEKSRGQSLTELALILPAFLLIVMIGLDFGRLFQGLVNLQQAARTGANYVSANSKDYTTAKLQTLIRDDAFRSDCVGADPTTTDWFNYSLATQQGIATGGTRQLTSVQVTVTCQFALVTPLGAILQLAAGSSSQAATFPLQADAIFPVRDLVAAELPSPAGGTPVPLPTAKLAPSPFGCTPLSGTAPLTVACEGGWSGSVDSWEWTWGDGSTESGCDGANPSTDGFCIRSHTYNSANNYTVTFTVQNLTGSASATNSITVSTAAPDPTAGFNCLNPYTTCSTGTATFVQMNFHSTSATLNPPLACLWNYGDGTTSTGCGDPTHFYQSGVCQVSLTVTNALNSSANITHTITVGTGGGTCIGSIVSTPVPTATPPGATPTPVPTPTPTPGPTATPVPYCIVPNFVGDSFTKNNWSGLSTKWSTAGFTSTITSSSFIPAVGGNPATVHHVATQTLAPINGGAGNSEPCNSTVTFTWN